MQVRKLTHAFLWEYTYKRLKLAQLLGQLGVFITLAALTGGLRASAQSSTFFGDNLRRWVLAKVKEVLAAPKGRSKIETDAKLTHKLGRVQPFTCVFPQEYNHNPTCIFWANLTPFSLQPRPGTRATGPPRCARRWPRSGRSSRPTWSVAPPRGRVHPMGHSTKGWCPVGPTNASSCIPVGLHHPITV